MVEREKITWEISDCPEANVKIVTQREILDTILGRLESLEYSSLVWGFVDGGFSATQLRNELESIIPGCSPPTPDDDIEQATIDLLQLGLLFEFKTLQGELIYRTRFAEGVRLFAHLRQLFPKHLKARGGWRSAPSLVSDFRVDLRPRHYPLRDQNPQTVIDAIDTQVHLSEMAKAVWKHLTTTSSGDVILLSGFQVRATSNLLAESQARGVIVTAGTGSGKTWAFYLPALVSLVDHIQPGQTWTKCLAIYPRVELLRDQFAEALRMCAKVAPVLAQRGLPPLTVGTLFGDTPYSANYCSWTTKTPQGDLICPYGKCPKSNCGGDLSWTKADRNVGRERLVCTKCRSVVGDDAIILTRVRAKQNPPDILFTTTEMLNKRIADTNYSQLLGIGMPADRRPRFVLLDEVHTYTGITGAQSAMVLRRWRHASRSKASFIGLSATLLGAKAFFAQLTGIPEVHVQEVSTPMHEMIAEGAEYQLVLQGDPVSQSSLLSTSIQSAMLLGRLMDPPLKPLSEGRYGERLFVFTDNLDVTNRLFDDLCDAERQKLAQLRTGRGEHETENDFSLRNSDGQCWMSLEFIGHKLTEKLKVGRTSSRDPGVASGKNVIVATASLEVGFNDSGVGSVIQHKAPKGMATFLQRKGRAGRPRGMRPWTITILSDYGRDRLTYQNYDQLFDPVLQDQSLPVKNLYILRMQALGAFFDWLALRAPGRKPGWYWQTLSTPEETQKNLALCHFVQTIIKGLLRQQQELLDDLSQYLIQALDLTRKELDDILWTPPRSLMMEALPTLQRRLATQWQLVLGNVNKLDVIVPNLPLPEFMPPNLFTELTLPEVIIIIDGSSKTEALPIARALKEILPGRVTRRFAEYSTTVSHWVPIDIENVFALQKETGRYMVEMNYNLDRYVDLSCEIIEEITRNKNSVSEEYIIYRPWYMKLRNKTDAKISDSCNAILEWKTHILADAEPLEIVPSQRSRWRGIVDCVSIYLHAQAGAVTVRRYGVSAIASLRKKDHDAMVRLNFQNAEDQPAGLGFEFETDGLVFNYRLPIADELIKRPLSEDTKCLLMRAYFRESVLNDPELSLIANHFRLDWLQQIYLTTLITWSAVRKNSIQAAHKELCEHKGIKAYKRAMQIILGITDQLAGEDTDGNSVGLETSFGQEDRLAANLSTLLEQQGVLPRMHEIAKCLYSPSPEKYGTWLRARVHESMAQALHYSCIQNVPRHADLNTILVDPDNLDESSEVGRIWITEDSLGGAGVMEALSNLLFEDQTRLFSGIEAAVSPSERELVALTLERVVSLAVTDHDVTEAIANIRNSYLHETRAQTQQCLHSLLERKGVRIGKAASVALNSRLLRPGTNDLTDGILIKLLERWQALQSRLGVAVSLREFCAIVALDEELRVDILKIAPGESAELDAVSLLLGILWPRSQELRQLVLNSYNPYRNERGLTDPRLITELLLQGMEPDVMLGDPDWMDRVHQKLVSHGCCRLCTNLDGGNNLASAVANVLSIPVDVGHLQFYPLVERYGYDATTMHVILALWEDSTSLVVVLDDNEEA